MSRYTAGAPVATSSVWIALRHRVARRELVDEAVAGGVVQRRALAADRLRHEVALAALDADDGGGVELDELEVGELRADGAGEQQAGAERARRIGRARPQGGGAAGGEDHRPPLQGAPVVGRHAGHAPVHGEQRPDAAVLEHLDARVLDDLGRELAQDPAAGGAPARVDDAADGVPALEAEREPAVVGRRRSATPSRSRSAKRAGASSHRTSAALRRTRSRPATSVSSRCWAGESSSASAAASPPCAQ